MESDTLRLCTKCNEYKEIELFVRKGQWHAHTCKQCQSAYNKEYSKRWRKANAAKIAATKAQEYLRNSEYIKTRVAKNKALAPDKKKMQDKRWRENNPERKKAKDAEWRANNPDRKAAAHRRRRAKKLNLPGNHTHEHIDILYIEQIGRCVYCGCRLKNKYHVDHIIPVAQEGSTNWPSNLQLLCATCNTSKGVKTNEEFVAYRTSLGLNVYAEAA